MPLPTRDEAAHALGVSIDAPAEEVKRAWRALALRSHPDKNPNDDAAAQRFRAVSEAFQVMSNAQMVEYRSYEQLAADNDDARQALARAMDMAKNASAKEISSGGEKVLKIGPATWIGEVEAGRPHGTGELILPNGAVHSGTFEAGRASGPGTLREANGAMHRGTFLDNKRVGAFVTIDPKGGTWNDVYGDDGKRMSRKKAAAPAANAPAAQPCRHCGVRFFTLHNTRCRQHSGKWLEASQYNADGSAAVVDTAAFPEGGLWLCCGSKSKNSAEERCTIGVHACEEAEPVPEERRIDGEGAAMVVEVA